MVGVSLSSPPLFELSRPPQLRTIPPISVPVSSWKRDGKGGDVVMTAAAINSDALLTGGPAPGSVEWLHHATAFGFTAPSEAQEAAVENVFRRCRYNAECADEMFVAGLPASTPVEVADAREELLGWWARRCWEDRRTKEAGEAVKREPVGLARAHTLSSWCRFATTARRAGHQACAITGGSGDLHGLWRQCRDARARPAEVAASLSAEADVLRSSEDFAAVHEISEACCADSRCLARVLRSVDGGTAASVWRHASEQFSRPPSKRR